MAFEGTKGNQMTAFDIGVEPSSEPTELCAIMEKYRGDKGSVDGTARHNYTRFYSPLFMPRRLEPLRVFELGIFCGASLCAWQDFFPNAHIFGADIDRGTMFSGERIKTFLCDETDRAEVLALWTTIGEVDVILDDGLHTYAANKQFFDWSWKCLRPGGLYIVEDIVNVGEYLGWVDAHGENGRLFTLPHHAETTDNSLLVLQKGAK
jgi:hypothetical protein